jgi:hypothetical protein
VEPLFPGGGFEAAPVFGVLVDDGEAAAGLEDAAEFGDGGFDVDGVFERFGGVDAVERVVAERQGEQRPGDAGERRTGKAGAWRRRGPWRRRWLRGSVPSRCGRSGPCRNRRRGRGRSPRGPSVSRTKRTWEMRGSMVEGKCSSSAAACSNERRISEARSGVSSAAGCERPNHFLNSLHQARVRKMGMPRLLE